MAMKEWVETSLAMVAPGQGVGRIEDERTITLELHVASEGWGKVAKRTIARLSDCS